MVDRYLWIKFGINLRKFGINLHDGFWENAFNMFNRRTDGRTMTVTRVITAALLAVAQGRAKNTHQREKQNVTCMNARFWSGWKCQFTLQRQKQTLRKDQAPGLDNLRPQILRMLAEFNCHGTCFNAPNDAATSHCIWLIVFRVAETLPGFKRVPH